MAGYRLFEEYMDSVDEFHQEVWRRTVNIDSSELQRVDRCTSAHGLEARVPFLDVDYVAEVMRLDDNEVRSFSHFDFTDNLSRVRHSQSRVASTNRK